MASAHSLISSRVVIGFAEERLSDLAARISAKRAHRCVVLENHTGRFLGLVRLAELAAKTNSANRILGDLISPVQPLRVREDEPADDVARLLEQHEVDEAVIEAADGRFVGLITIDSVCAWLRAEQFRTRDPASAAGLRQAVDSVLFLACAQAKRGDLPGDVKAAFQHIADQLTDKIHPEGKPPLEHGADRWRSADKRSTTTLEVTAPLRREPNVILVVEDHQASRLALCAFLNRRGYQTLEAATTAQALALVSMRPIDLVISDINLPDGSGHALMTQLREQYGLNGIATSALGAPEDVARSKASGFVLHITKPVRPDVLERILQLYFALEDAGAFAARLD
jgi:CheY-like chemotaxis protein/CBS domain-containing protein